jgi:iron complex outermembrane receptor protein
MKQAAFWLCVLSLAFSLDTQTTVGTPINPSLNQDVIVGKILDDKKPLMRDFYGSSVALTAEDIQKTNAKTVPDILAAHGFVKYSNGTGNDLDWNLNWRGFNSGQDIVVVVDGVKVNEADDNVIYWSNIPVQNIERIELMPGAQSALYGSGAFGGVINIYTKKKIQNTVEVAGGSYGYGKQAVGLGGAIVDNVDYALSYAHQASSGYRQKSKYDERDWLGRVTWKIDQDELTLAHQGAGAKMEYPVQLTEEELRDSRTQSPVNNNRDIDSDFTSLTYLKNLTNDLSLTNRIGWRNRRVDFRTVAKGGTWGDMYTQDFEKEDSLITQLNYLNRIILGYDYRLSDIHSYTFNFDRYQNKQTDIKYEYQATKGEYAPFLQYFETLGPVYVRYGVREDHVNYVNYDVIAKSGRQDKSFSKRTHNGEIGYAPVMPVTLYYSYGEAFKAPMFSQLFRGQSANDGLTSELAKTKEVGVRIKDIGNTDFRWAAYRTDVDDEIVAVFDPILFNATNQNVSKTRREGYSLGFDSRMTSTCLVYGTYTYTKARFMDGASYTDWRYAGPPFWTPATVDLEGYMIPQSPEHTYSVGCTYLLDRYTLNFVQNFVGAQYAASDYENEYALVPAYTFANAKIEYALADLTLYGEVDNVFNTIYSTKIQIGGTTEYYTPADLRTMSLGCKYQF